MNRGTTCSPVLRGTVLDTLPRLGSKPLGEHWPFWVALGGRWLQSCGQWSVGEAAAPSYGRHQALGSCVGCDDGWWQWVHRRLRGWPHWCLGMCTGGPWQSKGILGGILGWLLRWQWRGRMTVVLHCWVWWCGGERWWLQRKWGGILRRRGVQGFHGCLLKWMSGRRRQRSRLILGPTFIGVWGSATHGKSGRVRCGECTWSVFTD